MAYRGRGRGRGGFGGGRSGSAKQLPFELFPEIQGLGKAEYSSANVQLIKWSSNVQKYWNSSPYFYEDKKERNEKVENLNIERYSDRNLQATKAKPPLWHFIKLDTDHLPAELASKVTHNHVAKKIRWKPKSGSTKLDLFEKLEQKLAQEGKEKKDSDDEEEENEENEEEVEIESSDEGDYEDAEEFDDDEDDFNMAAEEDEGPEY